MEELARLEARRVVMEVERGATSDLATYGLDSEALTLTVETRTGDERRIYVGRETPDGTAFYVQREGDPRLYIVSHYMLEPFFGWLSDPPYRPTPTPVGARGSISPRTAAPG
jgi:hypothetical protein